ncbi:hypothetical protein [Segniliparus rugosus]|uniref:Iron uptake system component EfeO n=1 Tax=Segniliparus rugosus (strain ATCC BAA-974 / DSM 45345 / CCUG 50838 / CIP 108380 / JCM 13579 / CDC 945) TaxID=679197 RepID=E5XP32_SEGRC|nr:hypothetical protein [Segniliparus rugosus]EFV13924.2 hypothetical protein HMPREF9336_01253 [Segniliparus rugosus ATCC BAA-974]
MTGGRLALSGCLLLVAAGCASDAGAGLSPWAALWPGLPVTEVRAVGDGCVAEPKAATGEQVMAVTNTSAAPLELRVVLPDSPAAVFEIEPVAPASTRAQPVRLAPGRYRYACYFEERRVMYSEPFAVAPAEEAAAGPGPAPLGATRAILPVSVQDLDPTARAYEQWVAGQLPLLAAEARQAAAGGEPGKQGWLSAHRRYETLGAAYDAFGDAGEAVQAAFASAEAALWSGRGDPAQAGGALASAADALAEDFPQAQVDPLDLGLRAHEIVEDAIEKTLTGRDDHGSHSMLATLAANLDGVRELLGLLDPLLRPRLPSLDRLRDELDAAGALVAARQTGQRLNASFGQLAEHLAEVAAICDIRRSR